MTAVHILDSRHPKGWIKCNSLPLFAFKCIESSFILVALLSVITSVNNMFVESKNFFSHLLKWCVMSGACASSHFPPFSLQISLVFVLLQTTGLTAVWTTFWSILYTSQSTQHSSRMTSHVTPVPRSQLMICSAPVVPKPRQWYVLTFSNNLISAFQSFFWVGQEWKWTCFLQVLRGSEIFLNFWNAGCGLRGAQRMNSAKLGDPLPLLAPAKC